jgi:DNA-binding NarL/FixJ family response regulator
MSRRRGEVGKPEGLSVDLIDDDYAVFAWDAEPVQEATLTAAERDVLGQIVSGASNEQIARARKSSVRTVANQVAALLRKLGADSRFDLIRRYGGSGSTT